MAKRSPTYTTWAAMKKRCNNPRDADWPDYGGRGVRVCARWRSFTAFLEDMGERPPGTTLDRFPNRGGNYELSNCRWATITQQNRNRTNVKLTFELAEAIRWMHTRGQSYTQLAKIFNVSRATIQQIIQNKTWKAP